MDLTTLARVKALIGLDSGDDTHDALLGQLIASYSAEFEQYLGRHIEADTRTEIYKLPQTRKSLSLRGAPMWSEPTLMRYSDARNMVGSVTLMLNTDYDVDLEEAQVRFRFTPMLSPGYIEITYEGGMDTTTSNFLSSYPAIAEACDLQCAYHFKRRDQPQGTRTVEAGMGSSLYQGPLDLLDGVRRVLNTWRRRYA